MKIENFKKTKTKKVISTFKLPSRAKAVAQEVSAIVSAGGTPIMKEVMKKHGYAPSSTSKPGRVVASAEFQEAIDPVIKKMIKARDQALSKLGSRISRANYRDLNDGIDKLTKNIQLLSGKSTENVSSRVIILPAKREE